MDVEAQYAEPIDISAFVEITNPRPIFVGNYSYIYIGRFQGRLVAVKVLRCLNGATMRAMRRKVERERRVWAAVEHPNIVPFCGYAEGGDVFGSFGALISPWYEWGDAGKYLQRFGKSMTFNERVEMWNGVVLGVRFLHTFDPCIVHGDLKPGNILIDDNRNPRLCDFGLARIFADQPGSGLTTTSEFAGTERYLAFELVVCETTPTPSTASDVWALGCIGLEIIFLQIPYANRPNNRYGHIIRDISNRVPPASRPADLSDAECSLWDILESCWTCDPTSRDNVEKMHDNIARSASSSGISQTPDVEWDSDSFSDEGDPSRFLSSLISKSHINPISHHSPESSVSNVLDITQESNSPPIDSTRAFPSHPILPAPPRREALLQSFGPSLPFRYATSDYNFRSVVPMGPILGAHLDVNTNVDDTRSPPSAFREMDGGFARRGRGDHSQRGSWGKNQFEPPSRKPP